MYWLGWPTVAEVIPEFLTPDQRVKLLAHGEGASGWSSGRQGTGYETLYMKSFVTLILSGGAPLSNISVLVHHLTMKSLSLLDKETSPDDFWDVFLIRYKDGAYIPSHKDEAALFGKRHRRLNALIKAPEAGGELHIENKLIALNEGDAVLFSPDEEVHDVSPCRGLRLMWSVGCWL